MLEHAGLDTSLVDHIGLACPNCHPTVTFDPSLRQCVVEHIGAHILHDPSVDRSSKPCGLCLQPAPLCKIVLKKAKGKKGKISIDMEESSCPNLVGLSVAVATGCSKSSPCTNHPMHCPHCNRSESSSVVWSYNFRFHLLRKHPRVALETHSDIMVLTKREKDRMKGIWGRRHKQWKACWKSQHAPLVISEAHRSHVVLKCVYILFCQCLY